MTDKPLVSVVIPMYNCEKYAAKCLTSVKQQTYNNLQIIVIDDGSTDNTLQVIKNTIESDIRFELHTQTNRGVSETRNTGAKIAEGKYMTFIDGDDYIDKCYIERFVETAQQNDSDMCMCGFAFVDENGSELSSVKATPYQKDVHEEHVYGYMATCARFYKTRFWRNTNLHYEKDKRIRGEDIPVALVANAFAKNIQCIDYTGYYYVQHGNSAMEGMKGLKKSDLPYEAIENAIIQVKNEIPDDKLQFFEWGVIKAFGMFSFCLVQGASKEKTKELIDYQYRIVKTYFPKYYKNSYIKVFSGLQVSLDRKIAIKLMVLLLRFRLLGAALYLIRRI